LERWPLSTEAPLIPPPALADTALIVNDPAAAERTPPAQRSEAGRGPGARRCRWWRGGRGGGGGVRARNARPAGESPIVCSSRLGPPFGVSGRSSDTSRRGGLSRSLLRWINGGRQWTDRARARYDPMAPRIAAHFTLAVLAACRDGPQRDPTRTITQAGGLSGLRVR
jgi:hypothetical protein